ncbi:hypothetical protein PYW08_001677 [Mythimna loreyi]|uniref:Uncharacterized protein n=1 Tax=Mythimna loreyi TaxID=667449 RepID=A0ACC2R5X0_9NEOP|nr:hypothetical protein PYW08_001677 [Mythimna loreyi]
MNKFVFLFVLALCGIHVSSLDLERTNRIAGGSPASETGFRYMVSLQERSQLGANTRGHKCGGALYTLRHVVTSASCVHVQTSGQWAVIRPSDYRVFAGSVDLTNDTSADRHRGIERITVHPDYRTNTPYANDIAVITLASEFPSNVVSTVALAVNDPGTLQGPVCQASGWGSTDQANTASTQLMQITKTVYDLDPCRGVYGTSIPGYPQINIVNSMICALNAQTSSCQGDLGNPLVCNSTLNGVLIAHRNECSDQPNPLPEVYTRISSFRSWLQTTAGASTFKPGMAILGLICIVQLVSAKILQ